MAVPTSLSVVEGSETYVDPPRPAYNKERIYQILDQNGNPMQGYAPNGPLVSESYAPNPPSGNCTTSSISTASGYADGNGRFPGNYIADSNIPDPCTSTSTQNHYVNGRRVSEYTVTWTYSGVTIQ